MFRLGESGTPHLGWPHDQPLVIQNATSHETFIRRRIDPYHHIVAVFHRIDLSILCHDLELHLGVSKREPCAKPSKDDVRKNHGGADTQPATWDGSP